MKPQLHVTQLEAMFQCPERFRRQHGAKFGCADQLETAPATTSLAIGIAVHEAIAANLSNKMQFGALLSEPQVVDKVREAFMAQRDRGLWLTDKEAEDVGATIAASLDMAEQLAVLYHREVAPGVLPVAVEQKWVIKLPEFPFDLAGTIDLIDTNGWIWDWKTAKKDPTETCTRTPQTCMYGNAYVIHHEEYKRTGAPELEPFALPLAGIRIGNLVKSPKQCKYVPYESEIHEDWMRPLFRRIELAAQMITSVAEKRGVFSVASDSHPWACRKGSCPFVFTCDYWTGK